MMRGHTPGAADVAYGMYVSRYKTASATARIATLPSTMAAVICPGVRSGQRMRRFQVSGLEARCADRSCCSAIWS
jgi:hypothetical protein